MCPEVAYDQDFHNHEVVYLFCKSLKKMQPAMSPFLCNLNFQFLSLLFALFYIRFLSFLNICFPDVGFSFLIIFWGMRFQSFWAFCSLCLSLYSVIVSMWFLLYWHYCFLLRTLFFDHIYPVYWQNCFLLRTLFFDHTCPVYWQFCFLLRLCSLVILIRCISCYQQMLLDSDVMGCLPKLY